MGTKAIHLWALSLYERQWPGCQLLKRMSYLLNLPIYLMGDELLVLCDLIDLQLQGEYYLVWSRKLLTFKYWRGKEKVVLICVLSSRKKSNEDNKTRAALYTFSFLPGVVPEQPLSTSPVKRRTQSLSALPKDGDKSSPGKVPFQFYTRTSDT